jgi:hypothetical protein
MLKKLEYKMLDIFSSQNQSLQVIKLINGTNKVAHMCLHGTPWVHHLIHPIRVKGGIKSIFWDLQCTSQPGE